MLELLAALGILVVLASLLWGILATFLKNQERGARLAERAQIVRSLSQLLNDDLTAAIQDPVHPHAEATGGDDAVRRFGLYGTATTLRVDLVEINPFAPTLTRERQARAAAMGEMRPSEARVPELKTVYYDFVPPGAGPPETNGLTRREIDFETVAIPAEKDTGVLHAPEVVGCTFRYFDGSVWHDRWDSLANNGLPVAIEVLLRIMPFAEVERLKRDPRLRAGQGTSEPGEPLEMGADALGTDSIFQLADAEIQPLTTPSRVDLDELIAKSGLTPPISQRIVAYLPTSPIRDYREYERPKVPQKILSDQQTTLQTTQAPARQEAAVQQPSAVQPSPPPLSPPQSTESPSASPPSRPRQDWIRGKQ